MGGDAVSETNLEQFREVTPAGRFTLQNSAMLKVRLENDQIQAKLGSMVAYQGDVRFEHKSGGLGRFFKKAVTGEGVKLMAANGTGDLFLAQDKRKIMVLDLQNERMTVNGDNILAFEPGIDWDIQRVEGAGWVLIQPSEGAVVPEHSHAGGGGGSGGLESLFED